jgi:hypothetical protein
MAAALQHPSSNDDVLLHLRSLCLGCFVEAAPRNGADMFHLCGTSDVVAAAQVLWNNWVSKMEAALSPREVVHFVRRATTDLKAQLATVVAADESVIVSVSYAEADPEDDDVVACSQPGTATVVTVSIVGAVAAVDAFEAQLQTLFDDTEQLLSVPLTHVTLADILANADQLSLPSLLEQENAVLIAKTDEVVLEYDRQSSVDALKEAFLAAIPLALFARLQVSSGDH